MQKKTLILGAAVFGLVASAQAKPEFVLPEVIYAAPGIECNIYYANVFDSCTPEKWAFQTYAKVGNSWKNRWSWKPGKGNAGRDYTLVINAWTDEDDYPIAATTVVKVAKVPKAKGGETNRVTLALFGDSLTGCGYQDQAMEDIRKAGWVNYTPVGTRRLKENGALHDGYGGWSYNSYLKEYMLGKEEYANVQDEAEREQLKALGVPVAKLESWQTDLRRSPILKMEKGKIVLDEKPWLGRINGGKAPDYLFVMLGINATWWTKGTRAEVEKSTWETMYAREDNELLPFYKTIRKMLPDTVILLANTPLGGDQNAFTSNYGSDWNYVQQRKNGYALNKCLDKFVKMQNDPKLVFVGTAQAIDPFYGYMRKTHKVNSRCDVTEEVGANAVHPSAEGGLQVGDAMAAAVLWQMGKDLK